MVAEATLAGRLSRQSATSIGVPSPSWRRLATACLVVAVLAMLVAGAGPRLRVRSDVPAAANTARATNASTAPHAQRPHPDATTQARHDGVDVDSVIDTVRHRMVAGPTGTLVSEDDRYRAVLRREGIRVRAAGRRRRRDAVHDDEADAWINSARDHCRCLARTVQRGPAIVGPGHRRAGNGHQRPARVGCRAGQTVDRSRRPSDPRRRHGIGTRPPARRKWVALDSR